MSLLEDITAHLDDPAISAIVMEDELDPMGGPGKAICPPTYAGPPGHPKGVPCFAVTPDAFVPQRSASGWHHDQERRDGVRRIAQRVVINAVSACADNAETPLYEQQDRLGVRLPAIVLDGSSVDASMLNTAIEDLKRNVSPTQRREIADAMDRSISSWTAGHRIADSWLRYADGGEGKQVWADPASPIRDVMSRISHRHGDITYAHAPNAAIFGNWLSAGTAQRHAIPRAYTCEITGYGAHSITRAATKLDRAGGATNSARKVALSVAGVSLKATGEKPSEAGFGQVPVSPHTRAFQCELILREACLSLKALDRFRYPDDPDRRKARAAKRVYVLLALAGHLMAVEDGFLRSGCDLLVVESRWGWRRHGVRTPEDMTIPSLDDVATALREAIAEAAAVGLVFAEPQTVKFSRAEVDLIIDRVMQESLATADNP